MNESIRNILKENQIDCKKLTIKNNVRIISSDTGNYVLKEKQTNIKKIYDYLASRSFNYYPQLLLSTEKYDMYEYFEDIEQPREQSATDIMYLISLLHGKTTFYKEIDIDDYKYLYETIVDKIDYLYHYYDDLATIIEKEVYMSPAHYLFIRNIDRLYICLNFCRENIENWYQLIKNKNKTRVVLLHNNLELDHYLKTTQNQSCLISWDKSKIGMPVYDLEKFYRKYYLEFDFFSLLSFYESRFPLLKEEKQLFAILIALPEKIEFDKTDYELCVKIRHFFDYLYKTEKLIREYDHLQAKDNVER